MERREEAGDRREDSGDGMLQCRDDNKQTKRATLVIHFTGLVKFFFRLLLHFWHFLKKLQAYIPFVLFSITLPCLFDLCDAFRMNWITEWDGPSLNHQGRTSLMQPGANTRSKGGNWKMCSI